MDSKIPKPAAFQRKPGTLFNFNTMKKASEGTSGGLKVPLSGKQKFSLI